jgi:hypothetical protein
MPVQKEAAVSVEPKYFHSESSKGYLEADVVGEQMTLRGFWDEDNDEATVVFVRLGVHPDEYLYIAVAWPSKTIVGTVFATTDKQARRLLLEDMERRGWSFN